METNPATATEIHMNNDNADSEKKIKKIILKNVDLDKSFFFRIGLLFENFDEVEFDNVFILNCPVEE